MAFRTTPSLGPDIEQFDTQWWYDPTGTISPLLGNTEIGSDGHMYILVKAAAAIASAGTDVTINQTTWVATAGAGGGFETPVANIPIDAYFYARSINLPGAAAPP
jgi:hypothetical protein